MGFRYVKYCTPIGMLRTGNENPLNIENGWNSRNVLMLACCFVFEMVEINKPAPSVVAMNNSAAKHNRPKLPAKGTWKISREATNTRIMSKKPITTNGKVLP